MKKRIGNNPIEAASGFTLVELLVSMVILAIIVVPILTAFVSAAKANSKAKTKLEATTAAQNVMEEIKGTGVTSFLSDLGVAIEKSGTAQYVLDNSSETPPEGTVTIPLQNINGRNYRFKAMFDPTAYQDSAAGDGKDYNNFTLADIQGMDVLQDAFFVDSIDEDEKVIQQYVSEANPEGSLTEESVKSKLTREIDITIKQDGTDDAGIVTVGVDCIYTLNGTESTKKIVSYTIYDNSDVEGGKLRSVYLFYTPLYVINNGKASSLDVIKIFNNTKNTNDKRNSYKTNVYLIKQRPTTAMSAPEQSYHVDLEVDEVDRSKTNQVGTAPTRYATTVRTNIGYSFYKDASGKDVTIDGQFYKITYKYSNRNGSALDVTDIQTCKNKLGIGTIQNASAANRLYDVTIDVYGAGSTESLYTLTGTAES